MVAPGVAKVGSVSLVSGPRSGKAVDKKCTRLSRELDLHFKMLKNEGSWDSAGFVRKLFLLRHGVGLMVCPLRPGLQVLVTKRIGTDAQESNTTAAAAILLCGIAAGRFETDCQGSGKGTS